jgi:hypothetical protein
MTAATLAGTVSTLMFVASMLPMLVRAARTKDLASYSRGHLALSSAGNLVHSIYIVSLPIGPIWALHGFYLVAMGQMLVWHVRHEAADARRLVRAPSSNVPSSSAWERAGTARL